MIRRVKSIIKRKSYISLLCVELGTGYRYWKLEIYSRFYLLEILSFTVKSEGGTGDFLLFCWMYYVYIFRQKITSSVYSGCRNFVILTGLLPVILTDKDRFKTCVIVFTLVFDRESRVVLWLQPVPPHRNRYLHHTTREKIFCFCFCSVMVSVINRLSLP